MVDTANDPLEWETNSVPDSGSYNRDGCITEGMGISLSHTDAEKRGSMECSGKAEPHKCTRIESCRNSTTISLERGNKNPCSFENGQHDSGSICQQNGGHKITHSNPSCQEHVGILSVKGDHSHSGAPPRPPKSDGRHGKPEDYGDKHKQLETEHPSIQSDQQSQGSNHVGPICRETECSGDTLCQLEARPNGCSNRCVHGNLEGSTSICVPAILPDTTLSGKSAKRGGRSSDCHPSMAEPSVLPSPTGNVSRRPNPTATPRRPTPVSTGKYAPSHTEQNPQISGLENFRRSKQMQGVSEHTSVLLAAAWRKETQSAYNSCWRHWHSWCAKKQIDPFCATVEQIADFLSGLYNDGYEYRTINAYRSAISAFHPDINGIKVGQISIIKQLMTGIFNSRPPIPRYTETWDVDQVLKHLISLPENQSLSLKQLSQKVAMLMALTSACRSSEICSFDTKYMDVKQDEIVFTLTGLSKTRKATDRPLKMNFPKNDEQNLDVRQCILAHLERTSTLRGNESKLLVSFIKPHNAVKPCTVAGWLKNLLKEAGIDTNVFKAHSTRGESTSKANKFGISVQQIMQKANWKSASTFQKFYNKPVSSNENDKFVEKVLQLE